MGQPVGDLVESEYLHLYFVMPHPVEAVSVHPVRIADHKAKYKVAVEVTSQFSSSRRELAKVSKSKPSPTANYNADD